VAAAGTLVRKDVPRSGLAPGEHRTPPARSPAQGGTRPELFEEASRLNKQYIGDSVYVDFDGCGLVLTTENGYGPTNTIMMELEVYDALVAYVNQLKEAE